MNRYIPTGSTKFADKHSDAVAYVWTNKQGLPCAVIYFGKQSKSVGHFSFRTEAARAQRVASYFASRQASLAMKAGWKAERIAAGAGLVVGDIVNTCWGYDQTNREFYEVVGVSGKMVSVRRIAAETDGGSWSGKCVPQSGEFIGPVLRRLASNGGLRIEKGIYANKWNTATIAGVPVGPALSWSATH